ncbi:MAG: cytochrome c3 family protein, partial [Candidatus Zixiibacteriota bacterium]
HINRGVGCISCHGNVAEMEVVQQKKPLSMGWCLDCHRHPEENLRPVAEVTNMKWVNPKNQLEYAARVINEKNIVPPENCSGCHR